MKVFVPTEEDRIVEGLDDDTNVSNLMFGAYYNVQFNQVQRNGLHAAFQVTSKKDGNTNVFEIDSAVTGLALQIVDWQSAFKISEDKKIEAKGLYAFKEQFLDVNYELLPQDNNKEIYFVQDTNGRVIIKSDTFPVGFHCWLTNATGFPPYPDHYEIYLHIQKLNPTARNISITADVGEFIIHPEIKIAHTDDIFSPRFKLKAWAKVLLEKIGEGPNEESWAISQGRVTSETPPP